MSGERGSIWDVADCDESGRDYSSSSVMPIDKIEISFSLEPSEREREKVWTNAAAKSSLK